MPILPSSANLSGPEISRIAVSGFKSFATKADVEIRPLTVLAGANSSGKSSLMQPLLLMKQTLESNFNAAGPFLLSGPYVEYSKTRQFLSHTGKPDSSQQPLTLEFSFNEGLKVGMAYSVSVGPETGLRVVESWGSNAVKKTNWKISKNSNPGELKAMLLGLGSISISQLMTEAGFTHVSVQDSGFYQSILYSAPEPPGRIRGETYFMHENLELNSLIRTLIYVPGVRGGQGRKKLLAEVTGHGFFAGSFEEYVPSLIFSWVLPGNHPKMCALVEALRMLDLASGISPLRLSESELEVRVPRTRGSANEDFVNISDVGLAVPTILPVLVALIEANRGQLVFIEQPELHLHPRAQLKLARLLVSAANRGVRLVIETHSSLLLRGILTEVAQDKISSDRVILHWFKRDERTGMSTVDPKEPDAAGRVGEWPEDFSDVELGSNNEYLDAVETKLFVGKK